MSDRPQTPESFAVAMPYGQVLTHLARRSPDGIALVEEGDTHRAQYSWVELEHWANGLAAIYAGHGLSQGDLATIALPNGAEFIAACFAVWKLGAIPNPVSHRLPASERDSIVRTANPALVIGLDAPAGNARPSVPPDCNWQPASAPPVTTPERERAMTSGGSTGVPKLIMASNPALYDPATTSPLFRARRAVLVPGPLCHGAPFSSAFGGLLAGCKVVIMRHFDAAACLALIEAHQIDRIMMVPTMLQRIWRLPEAQREAAVVDSLEFILVGGAPCPAWLMRAWIEWLGPDVMHEAFGSSERSGGTFITGREWLAHPGSVGKPSPGCQLKILGEDGREMPPGEMGEIYVLPDGGAGSTYQYVGAQARSCVDGWESVGDMGYLDEDGYLYLGDRRTDMIVSGGRNVYPAEVEAALDAFPGVRSSAVIGLPHEDLGQQVYAIVDTAQDTVPEAALRDHLAQQLLHYKQPATIEFVSEPLRDDAGKLRRFALRAARVD